jgi:hypothetical protein
VSFLALRLRPLYTRCRGEVASGIQSFDALKNNLREEFEKLPTVIVKMFKPSGAP